MQPCFRFISSHHRRIQDGWEVESSYVDREIQIFRSDDYNKMQITIIPTLSTKLATLKTERSIFSGITTFQDVANANMLSYVGSDPNFLFHVRNQDSVNIYLSPFNPASKFRDPIELDFTDDDLMLVLERRDKNLIIEYYK